MLLEMFLNYLGAAAPRTPAVTEGSVLAAPGSGGPLPAPSLSLAVLQVPQPCKHSLADLHSALARLEVKPCPNAGRKKQAAREEWCVSREWDDFAGVGVSA